MNIEHSIKWYYKGIEYDTRKELQKSNLLGTNQFKKLCKAGLIYFLDTTINTDNHYNKQFELLPYGNKETTF